MKIIKPLLLILLLCLTVSARAKYSGYAQKGGKDVKTSTTVKYELMESYPACTITVYLAGATTLASIYSDNIGTVKANPFIADSTAYYEFYANNGKYDIKFSGTGITSPFTKADILLSEIIGPTISVDNAIARFDGTGGNIQNSNVIISDTGNITSPGTTYTFGDITNNNSARMDFTTRPNQTATTGRKWNIISQTFAMNNGPGGEVNYDDDTFIMGGYNTNFSGNKLVSGLVNFSWANEARFYNGADFQSEYYLQWASPNGAISIRPFSFDIDHSTGLTLFSFQGELNFIRQPSVGGAQWAILNRNDDGGIQLNIRPSSYISFANNNSSAFIFGNGAGNNSIKFGYVNNLDQIVLAPDGYLVSVPGILRTSTYLNVSKAGANNFILLDRTDQPSFPKVQIDVDSGAFVISPQTGVGLLNKHATIEGAQLNGAGAQIFDWGLSRGIFATTSSDFRFMDEANSVYRDLVAKDITLDGTAGTTTIYSAPNVIFRKVIDNQLPDLFTFGTSQFLGATLSFAPNGDSAKRIDFLTTGQLASVVPTGVAPFDVASSTPVTELIVANHPLVYNISGTLQTSQKIVRGIGTLSTGTIVVTFTSNAVFANTSFDCSGSNATNANAFKIANTSASSITITGTGSDVIHFQCTGN